MAVADDGDVAVSINDLKLDEARFNAATIADRGEVFLLVWLSGAVRALEKLPEDDVREAQTKLEATLLAHHHPTLDQLGAMSQTWSTGSHPCRSCLLPALCPSGDANALRYITSARAEYCRPESGKGEPGVSLNGRTVRAVAQVVFCRAALFCAGEIMLEHGAQVMSMYAEVVVTSLKIMRATSLVSSHPDNRSTWEDTELIDRQSVFVMPLSSVSERLC